MTPAHPMRLRLIALAALASSCIDYGVARQVEIESWIQDSHEDGVDILWVVDDSMSMYEEQEELATHTSTFVGFISNVSVDFRLGVVRTDMEADGAGELVGELLTVESPEISDQFSKQIENEALGSRDERGFDAALLAVDPSGPNAAEWTTAADLELIFFSDEDDHSAMGTEQFLEELAALRPDAATAVNAIVGDLPEGCASLNTAADPGHKYVSSQQATDGIRESICTFDYDAMLERVALKVLGLDIEFGLLKVPELNTMEVRVDDVLIHQRDRHGWRYDAGNNSLIFDGYAVPPPNSEITVRYYEWHGGPLETDESDTGS